jgi:hypothetical protein
MSLPLFQLPASEQQSWLRAQLARPAPDAARNLSDGFRLPGREGEPKAAAVLVPLVNRQDGLAVLFTQRSADLPDHPGQISFPGGRSHEDDGNRHEPSVRHVHLPEEQRRAGFPAAFHLATRACLMLVIVIRIETRDADSVMA